MNHYISLEKFIGIYMVFNELYTLKTFHGGDDLSKAWNGWFHDEANDAAPPKTYWLQTSIRNSALSLHERQENVLCTCRLKIKREAPLVI